MKLKLIIIILLLTAATILNAQEKNSGPDFFGYVKALHQTDLTAGMGQFSLIHARFGLKGNLNDNVSYRIFTELNRQLNVGVSDSDGDGQLNGSNFSVRSILLDAFMNIKLTDRLNFSLGQYKIPFSTSNLRSPVTMYFVNRPLTTAVTPGLRDIGLTFYYKNKDMLPMDAALGVYNGSGENTNENNKTMNYAVRVTASPIKPLMISANYYGGKIGFTDVSIFGFGLHAKVNNLLLDGEYVLRKTDAAVAFTSTGYFFYTGYVIETDLWIINSITPLVRYENYDPNTDISDNQLTRFTLGLNFGLSDKNFTGVRINYENRDSKNLGFNSNDYLYASFQVLF